MRAVVGGAYEVETDDGRVVEATLRGRLKQDRRSSDRVVAGDRIDLALDGSGGATVERVHERASVLVRRAPGGRHGAKPIAANVDQVAVVLAATHPEPNLRMLDRFLVIAEASGLPSIIVVNKLDLVAEADVRSRFAAYTAAGYPLLLTTAKHAAGVDALRERLRDRTSVLTGPSGVGKSSLLNALEPGLGLRVGEVSRAVHKGRHTTVSARLVPLACGGWVVDTPGLREVGVWDVPAESLDELFPELRPYLGQCRFGSDCSHVHEPGCAIRAAVERGDVDGDRYASYVKLLDDDAARR